MKSVFTLVGLVCTLAVSSWATPPQILCSIQKPLAEVGESIRLNGWVIPSGSDHAEMNWTVDAGKVQNSGSGTIWVLDEVAIGRHTARVSTSQSTNAECTLQLYVVSRSRGGRETGHGLLSPGQTPKSGYGLYSYFLLGAPPDDSARDRYLQAIAAHLRITPSLDRLAEIVDPADVNAMYLFLDASPSASVTPEWVLEHYDYVRARALLKNLPGSHFHGPYLVSSTAPIATGRPPNPPYLYQDLSQVPPSLVGPWYEQYLNQAAQDHFWETKSGSEFVLKLRTCIAVLALGLPDVQKSLDAWVKWVK